MEVYIRIEDEFIPIKIALVQTIGEAIGIALLKSAFKGRTIRDYDIFWNNIEVGELQSIELIPHFSTLTLKLKPPVEILKESTAYEVN